MLIALIAGEKNLIVDVNFNDLVDQRRNAREQHLALEEGITAVKLGLEDRDALALAEIRVQTMVAYVSCTSTMTSWSLSNLLNFVLRQPFQPSIAYAHCVKSRIS